MDRGIWPLHVSKHQLGARLRQMASQSSKQGHHQQINLLVEKVEGE